jgi:hypothetical protein
MIDAATRKNLRADLESLFVYYYTHLAHDRAIRSGQVIKLSKISSVLADMLDMVLMLSGDGSNMYDWRKIPIDLN